MQPWGRAELLEEVAEKLHIAKRNFCLCLVLNLGSRYLSFRQFMPRPARGAGTLIPSAQRLVWVAKQALGKAALGALFA